MITNNLLTDILKNLLERNITVELRFDKETNQFAFKALGFYKSGSVVLSIQSDVIIAFTRYNQEDEIHSWEDLVRLNFDWWVKSKERYDSWNNPQESFREDMIELGLIKKVNRVSYEIC